MATLCRSVQALGADVQAGYLGSAQQFRIDYELDSGIPHGCSAVDLDALAFEVTALGTVDEVDLHSFHSFAELQ
jgi:hypothetical protein